MHKNVLVLFLFAFAIFASVSSPLPANAGESGDNFTARLEVSGAVFHEFDEMGRPVYWDEIGIGETRTYEITPYVKGDMRDFFVHPAANKGLGGTAVGYIHTSTSAKKSIVATGIREGWSAFVIDNGKGISIVMHIFVTSDIAPLTSA